jgi:hypothetical protein
MEMLMVYLGATFFAGEDPYRDREFLLLFNGLIIAVMALLFFSVAEGTSSKLSQLRKMILAVLSSLTVVVNTIALSAISFRLSEWGITPNRLAVMGANILMLLHMLIICGLLWKALFKKSSIKQLERALASFLPIYVIWLMVIIFLFPLWFGFL